MCFGGVGGGAKTFRETLTQPRPDAFGKLQQSGEYFAPNFMLSSFGKDFALKFGGKDQKNKKGLHRKVLGYLITFNRFVVLFHSKKAFVVTCFWAKLCWSSCASTKVYSRLEGTSSDLGGHGPKFPPCISVARIFDWGGANQK